MQGDLPRMPASYFDVDGTLVTTNLVHPTVFYMLNQPTPMHSLAKLGRAIVKAPWMAMAELQDRRLFNEMLFSSFEGVSEALDFLMQLLADHLGATGIIANRLEVKDRFATGKLLRPVVAGPEKARLVREHARAHGHDLDECFAYSDSYSDVPMLSVVGHPAAVNPDGKLARLAETYGWPVLTLDKAA